MQVDRILRPLRNRCNALAAFWGRNPAPSLSLSRLPSPTITGSRVRYDKQYVDTLELARKIYDVRDCFKNILSKLLGHVNSRRTQNFLALTDLCAAIVGTELYEESDQLNTVATELFEAIPPQYQRKAVIAYSLDLILNLCPHEPTLILLLLDVTLEFGLAIESHILLRAVLTVACKPATSGPPLCNPAHQSFLVDLDNQWSSSGLAPADFVSILLDALRMVDFAPVCSSTAVNTFLLQLARGNIASYISSIYLISYLASAPAKELRHCLQTWLKTAFKSLVMRDDVSSMDALPALLHQIASLFKPIGLPREGPGSDLKNTLICLAAHWLTQHPSESTPRQLSCIKHILLTHEPEPTTYSALLGLLIASRDLKKVKNDIQFHSETLRSHGLLQHEASLWACTLRHIESPRVEQMLLPVEAIKEFRLELISQVEDAEERCFGRHKSDLHGYSVEQERNSSDKRDLDPTFECWLPLCNNPKKPSCQSPKKDFATLVSRAASKRTRLHPQKHRQIDDCASPDSAIFTLADPESEDALNFLRSI